MIICHVKYCINNVWNEERHNNTCSLKNTTIHDTGKCFNKQINKHQIKRQPVLEMMKYNEE